MAELTKAQKAEKRVILEKRIAEGQKVTLKEKIAAGYRLTWQEKLKAGLPLNELEEVQADADWNHNKRERDEAEKRAFEELKSRGRLGGRPAPELEEPEDEEVDLGDEDEGDDLSELSRADLNARAEEVGVENPEELPNKQAVIDAINEKGE